MWSCVYLYCYLTCIGPEIQIKYLDTVYFVLEECLSLSVLCIIRIKLITTETAWEGNTTPAK